MASDLNPQYERFFQIVRKCPAYNLKTIFLLDIQSESMDQQKNILDSTLLEWKKDVKQIDDILVIGIRW